MSATIRYSAGTRMIVMGGDDLRRDIKSAVERGLFAELDAELLAAAIVGIAFEVAKVMRQRKQTDVNSAARFCSELILRGVASLPVAVARPLRQVRVCRLIGPTANNRRRIVLAFAWTPLNSSNASVSRLPSVS